MKVLMIEPFAEPVVVEIDGSLKSMQDIVRGYIEAVHFYNDVVLVVNEEGKMDGSMPNRDLKTDKGEIIDRVYGSFFICEAGEEDFKSISDENAKKYAEVFALKEKTNLFAECEKDDDLER